jgi:anti-sigma-K factor RskA
VAPDATVPSAQLLWSRTHGLALSAASLQAPPKGSVYQVWLVTRTTPASVGVLVPAADGPTSVVFPWPDGLRRMVVGATVTVEPDGGSPQPTGAARLTSRIAPAAPSASTPPAGS